MNRVHLQTSNIPLAVLEGTIELTADTHLSAEAAEAVASGALVIKTNGHRLTFDEPQFTKRDSEQERVLSIVATVLREELPYSWDKGVRDAFLLAAKRVREGKR